MKVFHCDHCGHLLFFENTHCVRCGQLVAYLPDLAIVGSLDRDGAPGDGNDAAAVWRSPLEAAAGRTYRLCRNYAVEQVCNWAVTSDDDNPFCVSCRLTHVIPDLWTAERRQAWYRLEVAKATTRLHSPPSSPSHCHPRRRPRSGTRVRVQGRRA